MICSLSRGRRSRVVRVFVWALMAGACSDGSDNSHRDAGTSPAQSPEQPLTGYLVDSPVSGVAYATATQAGTTGPEGEFGYLAGETVRFTIGDTLLGEIPAQEKVTPFDLAGTSVLTGTPAILDAAEYGAHPFHHVVGLAVLLQSLDEDGDPGNGIEIGADVAALFDGVSLDLSEGAYDDPTLARIVRRANAEALFSVPHGPVRRAVALEHLYASMGVDANIRVPSQREWVNGEVPTDYEIEVFEYGEFGYVTYASQVDGDSPERVTRSRYDARGNLLAQEVEPQDSCSPGAINWQYDNAGNIIRIAWNWDYQGEEEFTERWRYGPDGSATKLTELDWGGEGLPAGVCGDTAYVHGIDFSSGFPDIVITEVAYVSDGVPDYLERTEFDANGNPTRGETDSNGDGMPDSLTSRDYDTDGNLTRVEADNDGDGAPDHIRTYEYDANGNQTRETEDEDGDGTPERIEITEFDANGFWTRGGFDEDGDGDIDRVIRLAERHASGAVIRGEFDFDGDGVPNEVVISELDDEGREVNSTVSIDRNNDGVPDYIFYDETDENRRTSRSEEDTNADGIPERIELFQYHPNGQQKRFEEITDSNPDGGIGDGIPDEIVVEEYDVNGREILREMDEDGDGKVDEIARWEYDDNDRLTRYTEYHGDNTTPEFIESWQYDDRGNLTRYSFDDEGDGTVDRANAWHYQYDAGGNVTRKAWDEGNDGSIDLVERWEYDEDGNLLFAEGDEQEDGEYLNLTTIDYVPGSWGAFFPSTPLRDPREEFQAPYFW